MAIRVPEKEEGKEKLNSIFYHVSHFNYSIGNRNTI